MIKTKFFRSDELGTVEAELNSFLEEQKIAQADIVKVYYNAVVVEAPSILNTVILIYKSLSEEESQQIKKESQIKQEAMKLWLDYINGGIP